MAWKNTNDRYGSLSIGLHWLMLLLLVAVYACMELREFYPKGSDIRNGLKTWHYMLGLSVFVLVFIRLAARLAGPTPRIEPAVSRLQTGLAHILHLGLYVLMIGMPLAGWLILSAEGQPIPFFGLHLPALIAVNKELAETISEIHETGGTVGYFLVGLHAVAALFHHYFMRDNTLLRMLPRRN